MASQGPFLTAAELVQIRQYEKIIAFHDAVISGTHPRIKIDPTLFEKYPPEPLIRAKALPTPRNVPETSYFAIPVHHGPRHIQQSYQLSTPLTNTEASQIHVASQRRAPTLRKLDGEDAGQPQTMRTSLIDHSKGNYRGGAGQNDNKTSIDDSTMSLNCDGGTREKVDNVLADGKIRGNNKRASSANFIATLSTAKKDKKANKEIKIDLSRDYYGDLGIQQGKGVTISSINRAFQHRHRVFSHRRAGQGDENSHAKRVKLARIGEAHAILSSKNLREKYDAGRRCCSVATSNQMEPSKSTKRKSGSGKGGPKRRARTDGKVVKKEPLS